jgi:hypothetical protein
MEKSRHDYTKYSTLLICVYYAYYISLHDKIKIWQKH